MRSRAALLFVTLSLGGCAAQDAGYPSLLPRAIESRSDAEPAAAPVVAAPDPALDAKLAEARNTLATARAAFDAALEGSRARITRGRGAATGSDAWLDAQVALGELDGHRATMLDLVQDLEALASERAGALQPPYPALDALRGDAEAELARERQLLADLTI